VKDSGFSYMLEKVVHLGHAHAEGGVLTSSRWYPAVESASAHEGVAPYPAICGHQVGYAPRICAVVRSRLEDSMEIIVSAEEVLAKRTNGAAAPPQARFASRHQPIGQGLNPAIASDAIVIREKQNITGRCVHAGVSGLTRAGR
jgi:hypothetical protein